MSYNERVIKSSFIRPDTLKNFSSGIIHPILQNKQMRDINFVKSLSLAMFG
jgi:hypothetical protein